MSDVHDDEHPRTSGEPQAQEKPTFEVLFRRELSALQLNQDRGDVKVDSRRNVESKNGAARRGASTPTLPEPYATYVSDGLAGICLSGGGIRSATFNLGLLDGLSQFGLLELFHYLSTVSGGGYVGGWWSAWRTRQEKIDPPDDSPGPKPTFPAYDKNGVEALEVRHLREFSNFLSPRVGFLEIETWQFVSSVLAAAVPALISSAALIVGAVLLYLLCAWAVMDRSLGTAVVTLGTFLVLFCFENQTARSESTGGKGRASWRYCLIALTACIAIAAACHFGRTPLHEYTSPIVALACPTPVDSVPSSSAPRCSVSSGSALFCRAIDCWNEDTPLLWLPLLAWAVAGVVVGLLRIVVQRWGIQETATIGRPLMDRVLARLLALCVVWLGGLILLNVSLYIASPELAAAVSASGVGGGMGVSFLLRRFVLSGPTAKQGSPWKTTLRVVTPQILSYVALALIAAGLAGFVLHQLSTGTSALLLAVIAAAILLLSSFLFNPNEFGLHPFYRSRVARTYLGASNFLQPQNRQVTPHKGDDILLCEVDTRPIHLVCLTANDLGGDSLGTLNRGARSATLSRFGFGVGNRSWDWSPSFQMSLASAVTAAGAAVNSNMGSYSKQLGGAVGFLLTSLNIRLGYWLRTDRAGFWERQLPGLQFFRELFGQTFSDDESEVFHLSDGGHFENLGLYELLRRRCRYIIASDCGADPNQQFEDLGNVLRRAREDFGVEIDIDLAPLKLDENKRAQQHVAVGDVMYPGGDRGVILYIKPVLVGGEPDDVLQYRLRNAAFPHETTGDQFYDEAQWESYRRLGLHAARTIFRFTSAMQKSEVSDARVKLDVDDVFGQARVEWYPIPPGLRQSSLERAGRRYDLEKQFAALTASDLLVDTYPELPWPPKTSATVPTDAEALARVIPLMNQMLQLFDDVYVSCDLKHHWNHPLNIEWMNTFGRWFTTPLFRTWWPILTPMFNRGAIGFARERFGMPFATDFDPKVREGGDGGVATKIWTWMGRDMPPQEVKVPFRYEVELAAKIVVEIAVAFVAIRQGEDAQWDAPEFFVPPSFWGAGIGRDFLGKLLAVLKARGCKAACVVIVEPASKDEARRKEHADLVQMYRQAGFKLVPKTKKDRIEMRRSL